MDCWRALAPHASWTSSATHAILPLLATDAGALLQVQSGVASHRRRFGAWQGGFWLPECAHAPWLDELLEDAGVRATCVELTRPVRRWETRAICARWRPLTVRCCGRLTARPSLWCGEPTAIPSRGAYRDSHRHTTPPPPRLAQRRRGL